MLLIEQNDEWLVGRRYLSQESLAAVVIPETELSGHTVLSPGPASPSPASPSEQGEQEEVVSALAA